MEIQQLGMDAAGDRTGRERVGWSDATDRWLQVFERYMGDETRAQEASSSVAPPSETTTSHGARPAVGTLLINHNDDGTRTIDRSRFRPPMPDPAEPGSSPASATAQGRQRAEAVSAFAEQIATATSEEERAFEERQLELTLARLRGEAPPATVEENQRLIAQRMQFRR